ncbi:Imm61 family immunity protein [Mycolicibacterium sp. BiH015]|uniref:Imm61 family immunity protein n=1 Tax=Mycolicibacterium sp. BiH015 TaxID=3018808 RepID=UPI0022E49719|nr:Imm61 family immunity protein [Mycolicibacterium sp. BiH015]MDA2890025.1 Imm61 family immunity protein [Mycolicibacterium sp. BiH015]
MTAPTVSPQLIAWASTARYAFTPEDDSGAALFWTNPGGETRLYIRQAKDAFVLTQADRASEEYFRLSSPELDTIERYLYSEFGADSRLLSNLPRVKTPTKATEVAVGYQIDESDPDGFRVLFDAKGNPVATARGRVSGMSTLVELSHLVSSSLEDIIASYRDPEGLPLFHI